MKQPAPFTKLAREMSMYVMGQQSLHGPDLVVDSDRLAGSTPPETGQESACVVGRPAVEKPLTAFHEVTETPAFECEAFDFKEALLEGGSFDGVAPLQDAAAGRACLE